MWSGASGAWPLATVRSETGTRWRRRCRGAGTVGLWFTKGTFREIGRAIRGDAELRTAVAAGLRGAGGGRGDGLPVRDGSVGSVQSLDTGQRS